MITSYAGADGMLRRQMESYHGKGTGDAKTMGALDYSYMNTT